MRYLALLPRIVFPADTGAKIRNLNMFSRLSQQGDEATIVCYRQLEDTDRNIERMRQICTRLEIVNWDEIETFTWRSYLAALKNLVSPYPYAVAKYTTKQYSRRVQRLLDEEPFDAIIADTAFLTLPLISYNNGLPKICFEHNVEYVIRNRQYDKEKNPLLKAFLYHDFQRLRKFEQQIGQNFDHLIMVSPNDCKTMAELGVTNTSTVPLGVDVDFFQPVEPDPSLERKDLVFTGSMDWLPNVDGLTWFVKEVLPLVRKRFEVHLWIVGRKPGREFARLAEQTPGITITGWVRDTREYIAKSAIYIVPLRIGGGTRIKIFEAMSMCKAVVSTSVGAEGLPVSHGQNIILSDTKESFAADIISLLSAPTRRQEIGQAARRLVVEKYSWAKAADVFSDICRKVIEEHRQRPQAVGAK
jgi:polysaccharide biosynthesis protein PslH